MFGLLFPSASQSRMPSSNIAIGHGKSTTMLDGIYQEKMGGNFLPSAIC